MTELVPETSRVPASSALRPGGREAVDPIEEGRRLAPCKSICLGPFSPRDTAVCGAGWHPAWPGRSWQGVWPNLGRSAGCGVRCGSFPPGHRCAEAAGRHPCRCPAGTAAEGNHRGILHKPATWAARSQSWGWAGGQDTGLRGLSLLGPPTPPFQPGGASPVHGSRLAATVHV